MITVLSSLRAAVAARSFAHITSTLTSDLPESCPHRLGNC